MRVAAAYLVAAWVVMQIVAVTMPALELPAWVDGFVLLLLAFGFLIVLVVSWMFELTAAGLKRTAPSGPDAPAPPSVRTDAILIAAVALLLVVSLVQVVRPRSSEVAPMAAAAAAVAPSAEPLSVAVLPFVNMSSDPEQEYFSDGLSEELLNVLAQIDALRVAGRTSSFAFKNQNQDLRLIGEALGVANILEGSVRRSGDRLRITAQLINAADGYHLWSETYDRELTDVFVVQEEIAMAVAEALSITLGVATAPAPVATSDVETYDLYLRGRAAFNGGTPEDLLRAAELFREVLARDPDYAPALSGLTMTYSYLFVYAPERRAEIDQVLRPLIAEWEAQRPDSWATHYVSAIARWRRREFTQAFRSMDRAVELAPASNLEVAGARMTLTAYVGRATAALGLAQAWVRSDPLSRAASAQLQMALDITGRRDEAEAEYRRSLDFQSGFEDIEHFALIRIWNDGDDALTAARFDRFLASQTVPMPLLAAVREVFDDPDAARALLRAGFDDPANQDPTRLMLLAIYAGHYGDPELAVAAQRRAHVELGGATYAALWRPDMAATRRTQGFKDLVRDLGMVDFWRESGDWGDFCRPVGVDDFECE